MIGQHADAKVGDRNHALAEGDERLPGHSVFLAEHDGDEALQKTVRDWIEDESEDRHRDGGHHSPVMSQAGRQCGDAQHNRAEHERAAHAQALLDRVDDYDTGQ